MTVLASRCVSGAVTGLNVNDVPLRYPQLEPCRARPWVCKPAQGSLVLCGPSVTRTEADWRLVWGPPAQCRPGLGELSKRAVLAQHMSSRQQRVEG